MVGSTSVSYTLSFYFPVPEFAKVKSWPVHEMNGWIYLWYHAEKVEPYWMPPEIDEITDGSWTYRGRTEHIINAHIEVKYKQAFFENKQKRRK